ncbi:MAG: WG repeat-containing protein [Silvanigrellaceae bacterium]|nr:WG repeat-containing protein [Silvanigrellaceae bacterium]
MKKKILALLAFLLSVSSLFPCIAVPQHTAHIDFLIPRPPNKQGFTIDIPIDGKDSWHDVNKIIEQEISRLSANHHLRFHELCTQVTHLNFHAIPHSFPEQAQSLTFIKMLTRLKVVSFINTPSDKIDFLFFLTPLLPSNVTIDFQKHLSSKETKNASLFSKGFLKSKMQKDKILITKFYLKNIIPNHEDQITLKNIFPNIVLVNLSLSNLPNEAIDLIAGFIGGSLLNWRLTSKEYYWKTYNAFLRATAGMVSFSLLPPPPPLSFSRQKQLAHMEAHANPLVKHIVFTGGPREDFLEILEQHTPGIADSFPFLEQASHMSAFTAELLKSEGKPALFPTKGKVFALVPVSIAFLNIFASQEDQPEYLLKFAYIDSFGNFLRDPLTNEILVFDQAFRFHDGFALVKKDRFWMYLDEHGKFLTSPQSNEPIKFPKPGNDFRNGFAAVLAQQEDIQSQSYLTKEGTFVTDPPTNQRLEFLQCFSFSEGKGRVYTGAGYAFIDEHGFFLTAKGTQEPLIFAEATDFKDGFAFVTGENEDETAVSYFLKHDGSYLQDPHSDEPLQIILPDAQTIPFFQNGFAILPIIKRGIKVFRFLNKQGNYLTTPENAQKIFECDEAYPFSKDGLARVLIKEKWYFINLKGEFLCAPGSKLPLSFSQAGDFINGFATVFLEPYFCYLAPQGHFFRLEKKLIAEEIGQFDNHFSAIKINNDWHLMDKKGRFLKDPHTNIVFAFCNTPAHDIFTLRFSDGYLLIQKEDFATLPLNPIIANAPPRSFFILDQDGNLTPVSREISIVPGLDENEVKRFGVYEFHNPNREAFPLTTRTFAKEYEL